MSTVAEEDLIARLARLRAEADASVDEIERTILAIRDQRLREVTPGVAVGLAPPGDPRLREAIPILIAFLRDTDAAMVWTACQTLGFLGAREAVPDLIDLLRPEAARERHIDCRVDPFGWYQEFPEESAIEGLKLMGATEAIPSLIVCLDAERDGTRSAAVDALQILGAREAATKVATLLADRAPSVRAVAEKFLRTSASTPPGPAAD